MPRRSSTGCARRSARSSSASATWSTACSSACWPTGTSCSRACPAWPRRCRSRRWRRPSTPSFQRIQFTPDLLPADLIGTLDLQPARRRVHRPSRARSSPTSSSPTRSTAPRPRCRARCSRRCRSGRSRSATRPSRCPTPFLVLATQNPIEQEGTYPLPEAQVDRFMLKLTVGYPTPRGGAADPRPHGDHRARPATSQPVTHAARHPAHARALVDAIYIDDKIKEYIVDLVLATRDPQAVQARPRALHPVRRLAARHDLPDPRRQGARLPLRPRLRHAAGRQGDRRRRAAPPRHRHLRGRGRGDDADTIVQRIFDGVPVP